MPDGRTTIRELARVSGVSVGTVSRALNGYPDVRAETRERVLRLARELDYTPAAAARTLVTRRSHVIGVFLETGEGHPDLQHPFFHEVLAGLKERVSTTGFDLLLFASEAPGNSFGVQSYLKRCRHHHVDGAVVMGAEHDDADLRRLSRSDMPCVGVDLELAGVRTGWVSSDNERGAGLAVAHLAEAGHARLATIAGPLDSLAGRDRLRGFRHELERRGLPYRDDYVRYGDWYVESGLRAMQDLLSLREPPTAVVAASDMMAVGAIRAARDRGLSVPGDASIVGFDDAALAAHTEPPLTTLRQDKLALGAAAGELLMRHIDSQAEEDGQDPLRVVLPVELIVRASTAAPRKSRLATPASSVRD